MFWSWKNSQKPGPGKDGGSRGVFLRSVGAPKVLDQGLTPGPVETRWGWCLVGTGSREIPGGCGPRFPGPLHFRSLSGL